MNTRTITTNTPVSHEPDMGPLVVWRDTGHSAEVFARAIDAGESIADIEFLLSPAPLCEETVAMLVEEGAEVITDVPASMMADLIERSAEAAYDRRFGLV